MPWAFEFSVGVGQRCGLHSVQSHFFALSPCSTMRISRRSHIAGFRLAVASGGGFESQPVANFDSVRIYSRSLQLIDMQKHVGTIGVVCDKSESAVSIPHFQFSSTHPIFPFLSPSYKPISA